MEPLKVLITVKTMPIPSAKYDELVCTAGVREDGSFVRLYPINFRDLPYAQQYKKYQWIQVQAEHHTRSHDARKESYRPDCKTLQTLGEPIPAGKPGWPERAAYALAKKSQSLEELKARQDQDGTSLGIFKPARVERLLCKPDDPEWKSSFKAQLAQQRLWEERTVSIREPVRKLPWKFQYRFWCEDRTCVNGHEMMIEDWELSALYWRTIGKGADPDQAVAVVRQKFFDELCGPHHDTHFYVGTVSNHPKSWVVIGLWYPKLPASTPPSSPPSRQKSFEFD